MILISRYIVLAGQVYYPIGWGDYRESYPTELEARAGGFSFVWGDPGKWFQVVDLYEKKIVFEAKGSPQ